jgi:hypothetical protein
VEEFLIVDGYNIINNWPNLAELKDHNLEHARDKLLETLQNYAAYKNIKIILVFDAHLSESKMRSSHLENGVEVIYSKKGETADMVIEKIIDCMPPRSKVIVATSDWAEQRLVMGKGALRMPARELYYKVQSAEKNIKKTIEKTKKKSSSLLEAQLEEEVRKKLEAWRRKS